MQNLLQLVNGWKTYSGAALLFLTGAIEFINALNGQGDLLNAITIMSGAIMGTGLKHATTKAEVASNRAEGATIINEKITIGAIKELGDKLK
jgi:hypothetical protein